MGDDITVIYSVTMIRDIRRTFDESLGMTGYTVWDARTGKQFHTVRGSQAERCIRYFGERIMMKHILTTAVRNEHGNVQIEHISVL